MRVHGEDTCPPTPTVLNIGQFMTEEEMTGGMGEPQWFVAYSHALQWVGEAAQRQKWDWTMREAFNFSLPAGAHLLARNRHGCHSGLHQTVLGARS